MSRAEKCFGKPVPISPEYDPIKGWKVSYADYNIFIPSKKLLIFFLILPIYFCSKKLGQDQKNFFFRFLEEMKTI